MVQAVSSDTAKQGFQVIKSKGTGRVQWRTQYMGARYGGEGPQAFLVEMSPNGTFPRLFHAIDQFQVFVAGNGSMGRNGLSPVTVHYVDHYTPYGPIDSGPLGLSFFTLRAKPTPGPVYQHNPEYNELLKPTKKRYLLAGNIPLSTQPVMQDRGEVSLENLEEVGGDDGLCSFLLRLGADMKTTGSDPKTTGSQYFLVLNGSAKFDEIIYPRWSTIYSAPTDPPLEVYAGPQGLEALILNFPRPNHDLIAE